MRCPILAKWYKPNDDRNLVLQLDQPYELFSPRTSSLADGAWVWGVELPDVPVYVTGRWYDLDTDLASELSNAIQYEPPDCKATALPEPALGGLYWALVTLVLLRRWRL